MLASSVVIGQAYSPLPLTGQGGEFSPSSNGLNIHVDFSFKGNDPSRAAALHLTVSYPNQGSSPNQVSVSVDGGLSWVPCTQNADQTWGCIFSPGTEPLVSAIADVLVSAK